MPINARLGRTEQLAGLPSSHSSAPTAVCTLRGAASLSRRMTVRERPSRTAEADSRD